MVEKVEKVWRGNAKKATATDLNRDGTRMEINEPVRRKKILQLSTRKKIKNENPYFLYPRSGQERHKQELATR